MRADKLVLRIIAVAQTQPRHGGGGALYVLLKRQRGDP